MFWSHVRAHAHTLLHPPHWHWCHCWRTRWPESTPASSASAAEAADGHGWSLSGPSFGCGRASVASTCAGWWPSRCQTPRRASELKIEELRANHSLSISHNSVIFHQRTHHPWAWCKWRRFSQRLCWRRHCQNQRWWDYWGWSRGRRCRRWALRDRPWCCWCMVFPDAFQAPEANLEDEVQRLVNLTQINRFIGTSEKGRQPRQLPS